jgi:endonuclease YncB( thermonuclease family)
VVFLSLLPAPAVLAREPVLHGRVVGISDGDTIKVLVAKNQVLRIRIAWIDALVAWLGPFF